MEFQGCRRHAEGMQKGTIEDGDRNQSDIDSLKAKANYKLIN
jgi:hypothetical protein